MHEWSLRIHGKLQRKSEKIKIECLQAAEPSAVSIVPSAVHDCLLSRVAARVPSTNRGKNIAFRTETQSVFVRFPFCLQIR